MSSPGRSSTGSVANGERSRPSSLSVRRRLLYRFLVMAGASCVVVILVEVAFRLFVPVTDVPLHFWDPVLGPRKLPNQSGRWLVGRHVAGSYRFNAQGWNHKDDYELAKPSGTRRVCVVGDSYVEALQVDVEETLFAVAERRMNRADCQVQWYAFGVSGWGTANGFEVIRHYVLDYQPDVVILPLRPE